MRVIGGTLQGKRLRSFKGQKIRPTSDRVKEALFNIITDYMDEGITVLDLFAGTGNLAIEAISRGAKSACLVEKERASLAIIRENLDLCRIHDRAKVMPVEVKKAIPLLEKRGEAFDIIFIDPPYSAGLADETLESLGVSRLSEGALVIAEESSKVILRQQYGELVLQDRRKYGDTALSFFKRSLH